MNVHLDENNKLKLKSTNILFLNLATLKSGFFKTAVEWLTIIHFNTFVKYFKNSIKLLFYETRPVLTIFTSLNSNGYYL